MIDWAECAKESQEESKEQERRLTWGTDKREGKANRRKFFIVCVPFRRRIRVPLRPQSAGTSHHMRLFPTLGDSATLSSLIRRRCKCYSCLVGKKVHLMRRHPLNPPRCLLHPWGSQDLVPIPRPTIQDSQPRTLPKQPCYLISMQWGYVSNKA